MLSLWRAVLQPELGSADVPYLSEYFELQVFS